MRFEKEIIAAFFKEKGFFVQVDVGHIDIVVVRVESTGAEPTDFVLDERSVQYINAAACELSIWPSNPVFYPSRLAEHFAILEENTSDVLKQQYKRTDFKRLLILDSFPRNQEKRVECIGALKGLGFDYALEFAEVLKFFIHNIGLLKNTDTPFARLLNYLHTFGFVKDPQLEIKFK